LAFYDPALPDPGTSRNPAERTRKPAVVLQYATDAWYVVQTDLEPPSALDAVLRIAAAVRFEARRPMRFPIRLGYLPDPLRPCGGLDGLDPGRIGPWNAWIDLCDGVRGSGVGDGPTAIRFSLNRDRTDAPRRNGPKINGLPLASPTSVPPSTVGSSSSPSRSPAAISSGTGRS
jgi:hypothetical protein